MTDFEDSSVTGKPCWTVQHVVERVRELYGIKGEARELPSERDQNFRITTASGERFVFKVSNPAETLEILTLQDDALRHLDANGTPRPVPAESGPTILAVEGPDGTPHHVRLLNWIPGRALAACRPHGDLLVPLGRFLANLDRQLAGFDHAAADRRFYWDLRNGFDVASRYAEAIDDGKKRARVERMLAQVAALDDRLQALPLQVIHGDANDHNLLVDRREEGQASIGLIDFGDMVRSWRVADPAILMAYAMLDKRDPLQTAATIAAAYHAVLPLDEAEIEALFLLACLRLCTSVCIAAHQRRAAPDNAYLGVTERPAWELLERLDAIHPRLARYTLRAACGLEACPGGSRLAAWISENADRAAALVSPDPRHDGLVLDLSVGSVDGDVSDADELTRRITDRLATAGRTVGIGRYDEPRLLYAAEQFAAEGEELPERRTVHLGIDLFQPAGSPVFAPFAGRIHSFADNDLPLDYGPTVILEHDAGGVPFYTLHGHLSRESLRDKQEGQALDAGEKIGEIGESTENGGWSPHVHFQVVTDLLDMRGNFPGVARASQRDVWLGLVPDATALVGGSDARYMAGDELEDRRRSLLGPSLGLSYSRPLTILRGRGAYLYDQYGNGYLDCVNNVCHVGHAHPDVVRAATRQIGVLNTNTRYLHPAILEYSRRLSEWFPEHLSVFFFVNSGSEANELALRLARTFTGREGIVAVEAGYHGNSQGLIDVSSYKCEGPGGDGPPDHVRFVPLPDPFRGRYRESTKAAGERYAAHIGVAAKALTAAGHAPAAFLAEAWSCCGGQIVPPDGWLEAAFAQAREHGAVCIADEVQTGFGRLGHHRWAFEQQGARPDIVTLGKPIGNGHPLGAVVTTTEIAAAFDNGVEYFNTFGGNPVSCATGLAVLDVLRRERLPEHAGSVGRRLIDGLRELAGEHPLVGEVRGSGLFLGVELVLDRASREPARRYAAYVVERMRDHGILLSVDGPAHNVIKIKPPLVFSSADADRLVETLGHVLGEDRARPTPVPSIARVRIPDTDNPA